MARTWGRGLVIAAVLLHSGVAVAQQRRVVAVCPVLVEGGSAAKLGDVDKYLSEALVKKRIARADAAALEDALEAFPAQKCPTTDRERAELARTVGATDVLQVRIGEFPLLVGGTIVSADPKAPPPVLQPIRANPKLTAAKAVREALDQLVEQLPFGEEWLVSPLVDPPKDPVTPPVNTTTTTQAQPPAITPPPPPAPKGPPGWAPWAGFGVGAAALAGSGGAFLLALDAEKKFNDLVASDVSPRPVDRLRDLQSTAATMRTASVILAGVGAAGLVTGGVLMAMQPPAKAKAGKPSAMLLPSSEGVIVIGRF